MRTQWPPLETASRDDIAAHQLARLREGLREILKTNAFYRRKLAGVEPEELRSLDDLRALPPRFELKAKRLVRR